MERLIRHPTAQLRWYYNQMSDLQARNNAAIQQAFNEFNARFNSEADKRIELEKRMAQLQMQVAQQQQLIGVLMASRTGSTVRN